VRVHAYLPAAEVDPVRRVCPGDDEVTLVDGAAVRGADAEARDLTD
jgi:hypothetical protein